MISTSAFLALVLQCSPLLQPVPLDPIAAPQALYHPNVPRLYGVLLPCSEQKVGTTATTAAFGKKDAFAQDLYPITKTPLLVAEADLNDILPGQFGSLKVSPSAAQLNVPVATQPTFESWDVLRQYPRMAPLAEPHTPAAKPTEPPKLSKDSKDAQGKTAPE